jgi:hypothetical protein
VSDTVRGVIVFVSALVTIALWVPLRNHPERLADGSVVSETYFGAFGYLTLRTELKEPEYKMSWMPKYRRLITTVVVTAGLWAVIIVGMKKGNKRGSSNDSANLSTVGG